MKVFTNYDTVRIGDSMKVIKSGLEVERNPLLYFTISKKPFLIYQDVTLGEAYLASVVNEDGKLKLKKPEKEFQDTTRKIIQLFIQPELDKSVLTSYDFGIVPAKEIEIQTLEEENSQKIMLSQAYIENLLKNEGIVFAQNGSEKSEVKKEKNHQSVLVWLLFFLILCAIIGVIYLTFFPNQAELKSVLKGETTIALMDGEPFVDPYLVVTENGKDVTEKATITTKITKDGIAVPYAEYLGEGTYLITYHIQYKEYENMLTRTVVVNKQDDSIFTGQVTCEVNGESYSEFFNAESDTLVYEFLNGSLQGTYTDTVVGVVEFEDTEKDYTKVEDDFRNDYCSNSECDFAWNDDQLTVYQTKTLEEEMIGISKAELIQKVEEEMGETGICK